MKKHLVLITFLFPIIILSQPIDSLKFKKNNIGLTFSTDYCFRTIKTSAGSEQIFQSIDSIEVPKFGYTVGFNYIRNMSKKISISTGILFSDKGEKTKQIYSSKTTIFNYNNKYYYLDIPLKVDYRFFNKKIKFFMSAGISGNIFLIEKTTQTTGFTSDDVQNNFYNHDGFSNMNMSVLASAGVDFPLINNWIFKIESVYRRSITPISNTPLKKYLYSLGINFGLFKSF